jgi:hypothetical protein
MNQATTKACVSQRAPKAIGSLPSPSLMLLTKIRYILLVVVVFASESAYGGRDAKMFADCLVFDNRL